MRHPLYLLTLSLILLIPSQMSQAGGRCQQKIVDLHIIEDIVIKQKLVAANIAAIPLLVTVPVVPYAVPVNQYNQLPQYWSVRDYYQQKSAIQQLTEELRAELRASRALRLQQPVAAAEIPEGRRSASALETRVLHIVANNCARCHGAGKVTNGLKLVTKNDNGTFSLQDHKEGNRWKIYGMVSAGLMPPDAKKDAAHALSNEDTAVFLQWAKADAPE